MQLIDQEFEIGTFQGIDVETEHPLAVDSPDHLMPWGTARDNHSNPTFNARLLKLFERRVGLRILDLGCSGGGFVKSCTDQGCLAVGLEGSDYSIKFHRANWPLLGGKLLFTADITKPFQVHSIHGKEKRPLTFNVITMWEVLEHLKEEALVQTIANVKAHLVAEGLLMVSVACHEEVINGVRLHQTVRSSEWWVERFRKEGFFRLTLVEQLFSGHFIRDPKTNAAGSINYVFCQRPDKIVVPPTLIRKKKWYRKFLP